MLNFGIRTDHKYWNAFIPHKEKKKKLDVKMTCVKIWTLAPFRTILSTYFDEF